MNKGWQIKKLGEVCEISTGKSNTEDAVENGKYAFFDRSKIIKKSTKFLFDCDAIIVAGEGQTFLPKFYSGKFDLHQRSYAIYNFDKSVSVHYAYKYLIHFHKYFEEVAVGATAKSLRLRHFQDLPIPIPSLPEQHRIVSILDQCFSAIEKTKANAEQNLKNAREMFDCTLNSILYDKKWKIKKLGEVCEKVEYGTSSKSQSQGIMPVLRMGNIQNGRFVWDSLVYSNNEEDNKQYLLKYNDVLFNRTNSPELVGKTAIYKGERPAIFAGYLIRINRKENLLDADYLNYYLNSKMAFEYGKTVVISSVNQANINGTKLKTYPIPLPTLQEQQFIVRRLDALRTETQKLETVYQKKIANLEELRKSVLQRAFSGALTSSSSTSLSVAKIIPLQKIEGISPTDLQAGITAMALQKHIEKNKHNLFGHVKSEKIVHLAEYILNVDLERYPVKDAAGPNDFPHAKKVESRASKAGFYTVSKKEADKTIGYIYSQGNNINTLISKVQNCLGDKNNELSQLLNIITPMTTQQAEIVATIYAAWNNLLLRSDNFSDEDIVTEARENWHKEKLKIPRKKFFDAIGWMKKNPLLIPKGNGKIVIVK